MKFLSDILVKAGVIIEDQLGIGTNSPLPGYNIDSRGSHAFGDFTAERYHYFQSASVAGGSALSVYANNTSANNSRSHIMLADTAASVPTRFGLGVFTGVNPYAYLDSASKLVINNASGANVIIGSTVDTGHKLAVNGFFKMGPTAGHYIELSPSYIYTSLISNTLFQQDSENIRMTANNTGFIALATQTIDRLIVNNNGTVTVSSMAGTGTRMVVANDSGVLSAQTVPTLSSLGGVPASRTLTINGTSFDLSADRSWTIPSNNIYNSDGTLTGNRTVTLGTNTLNFAGGNVGINQSAPTFRLDVNGTSRFVNGVAIGTGTLDVTRIFDVQVSSSSDILHRLWNTGTGGAKIRLASISGTSQLQFTGNFFTAAIASSETLGLDFRVSNDATTEGGLDASTRMRITKLGNVIIGTGTPNNYAGHTNLAINNTTSLIEMMSNGTVIGRVIGQPTQFVLGTASNLPTSFITSDVIRMQIFGGGNIGINTTTDAGFRLDVNGTVRSQGVLEVVPSGGITMGGGVTALSYASTTLNVGNSATWARVSIFAGGVEKFYNTSTLTQIQNTTINLATTNVQMAGVGVLKYSGTDLQFGSVDAGFTTLTFYNGASIAGRISAANNWLINTTTDSGFRLDVNGTMRVQNALTVNTNSGTSTLIVGDGTTGTNSTIRVRRTNDTQAANIFFSTGTATDNGGIRLLATSNNLYIYNGSSEIYLTPNGNIGVGTASPAASAILDITSTTRGVLLPRMTTTQQNAIASPATGLIVYDITDNEFDYFNGTAWTPIRDTNIYNANGTLTGNRTVTMGVNTLTFTSTNAPVIFTSGGTSSQIQGKNVVFAGGNASINDVELLSYENYRVGTIPGNVGVDLVTNLTSRLRVHGNGNIGINTSTDAGFRLDVNGTARVQTSILSPAFVTAASGTNFLLPGAWFTDITRNSPINSIAVRALVIENANNGTTIDGVTFSSGGIVGTSSQQNLFFNRLLGTLQLYQGTAQTFATTANLASSILSIESTTRGVLLPRMTTTQRNAIASPATGLIVYDTTDNEFDYYNGTAWTAIRDTNLYNADGTLTGNRTISLSTFSLTIAQNQNANTNLIFSNTTSAAFASVGIQFNTNAGNNSGAIFKYSTGSNAFKNITAGSLGIYNDFSGDIALLNNLSTGRITFIAGGAGTAQMTLFSTGNFAINTTTDAGFRLDVNGTARVQGNFTQTGSSSNAIFGNGITLDRDGSTTRIFNGGQINYQSNSTTTVQHNFTNEAGNNQEAIIQLTTGGGASSRITGTVDAFRIVGRRAFASGSATYNAIRIEGSVENTGTFTGIHTGIFYNPSIVGSGFTHRAIHTVTGDVLLATTSGNVGIGTTSPVTRLDVNGTFRYSYSDTALVNGQFGSLQATTYTPGSTISNRNLYNTRANLEFNLTAGAINGSESFNVAADFSQVVVYGNASTTSTQPIRAYLVGLVGGSGLPAMRLSDFRYFDVKSPDAAGVNGHQVETMYGLRIGQMRGSSNFNITTGYGIFQAGSSDLNYFAGGMLLGTLTNSGFLLDVNGTMRVQGVASLWNINNGANGLYSNTPAQSQIGLLIGSVSNGGHTAIFTKGNNSGSTAIRVTDQNVGASVNHFIVDFAGSSGFGLANGNTVVHASALVEIASTSKGFLPPRMTTAQRDAIASPATGLIVFNTTTNVLNFYDGTSWNAV